MSTIKKAVAAAVFMVVVYHALSSHDERPVMVSKPFKDEEEAKRLAAEMGKLEGYSVKIFNVEGGQAVGKLFESFEIRGSAKSRHEGREIEPN